MRTHVDNYCKTLKSNKEKEDPIHYAATNSLKIEKSETKERMLIRESDSIPNQFLFIKVE